MMAFDGATQPLISGLIDIPHQTNQKNSTTTTKRRRFRHCISAPTRDFALLDKNGALRPPSESIFGNLHHSFTQVALFLAIYLGVGALLFFFVKNEIKGQKTNGFLDAIYFCVVTMTSVGYGDLVPNSVLTKLLACCFVFTGMALIAMILSKAADYFVEKQEILLVKALYINQQVGTAQIQKEVETNRVKYKFVTSSTLLLLLIIVGTIFLNRVENLDLVDAFYCVCSTITTLGYGDKSFSTQMGRVFAVFWILTSTICLAQCFLYLAELNTEHRQQSLVKWVLTRQMTCLDLEAADLSGDGTVSAAEFVIYKLKEMGKISQEDIALVLEEFENLDVDESGTLTTSDLELAQSSKT